MNSNMKPLKLTFRLRTPMVSPQHPIHLDGILEQMVFDRSAQDAPQDNSGTLSRTDSLAGILAREVIHGIPIYKASMLIFDSARHSIRKIVRRTEPDMISLDVQRGVIRDDSHGRMPPTIDLSSGPMRNWMISVPITHPKSARAYCEGDREAIADLLSGLTHLGAKRRLGFGELAAPVLIEEMTAEEQAQSLWRTRAIPLGDADMGPAVITPVSPPYWERSRSVRATYCAA